MKHAAFDLSQPLNGRWELAAGRAVSLRPRAAGRLRIVQGRVWATLDGPHERLRGDLFLEAGSSLPLRAGQGVVIEPYGVSGPAPVWFSWEPARARFPWRWPAALVQRAARLRVALGALAFSAHSSARRAQGCMS